MLSSGSKEKLLKKVKLRKSVSNFEWRVFLRTFPHSKEKLESVRLLLPIFSKKGKTPFNASSILVNRAEFCTFFLLIPKLLKRSCATRIDVSHIERRDGQ